MLRGSLNGRTVWGRMNTDIGMAESLCCLLETYVTLLIGYTPIKIKLKKKKVSLLLSRIHGYCYHLSKFHIYALVYCIGVFLSGLLHSV